MKILSIKNLFLSLMIMHGSSIAMDDLSNLHQSFANLTGVLATFQQSLEKLEKISVTLPAVEIKPEVKRQTQESTFDFIFLKDSMSPMLKNLSDAIKGINILGENVKYVPKKFIFNALDKLDQVNKKLNSSDLVFVGYIGKFDPDHPETFDFTTINKINAQNIVLFFFMSSEEAKKISTTKLAGVLNSNKNNTKKKKFIFVSRIEIDYDTGNLEAPLPAQFTFSFMLAPELKKYFSLEKLD